MLFSIVGFDSSDEAAVIERLLAAFGEGDEEEITKCTSDPVYKCMDNEVSSTLTCYCTLFTAASCIV